MELSPKEVVRYGRHLSLTEFGYERQLLLKQSKVLVVGAGGLGSPLLLYLAAAGIGTIGIVDHDSVDLSNLQRQILYTEADLGRNKALAASERLSERNSTIKIVTYPTRLSSQNALQILSDFDVLVDGTDNFATRYLLNDASVLLGKPLVYGSILRFEGHVAVFNVKRSDGTYSAGYRDLFPLPPDPLSVPNCEQAGVLGILPGLIGCLQANEVIKIIAGIGETLADRLLIVDSLSLEQNIISIKNLNSRSRISELIDYDEFCSGGKLSTNKTNMKEITVQELKEMIDSKADFQLIDVREPHEYDICEIGG
jgi:sulfur-carrier protein adenylyltransferase/sulfurtransferase